MKLEKIHLILEHVYWLTPLSVFHKLMPTILQGQEWYALAYLDDILAFYDSVEQNLEHIQMVSSFTKHKLI